MSRRPQAVVPWRHDPCDYVTEEIERRYHEALQHIRATQPFSLHISTSSTLSGTHPVTLPNLRGTR